MLQRFTRRQLLALLPGGLLVATSRAQALEEGRSVLGYQLDLSILFNFLTLSLAGKVVQEIDRRAGRYRVTMDGKGTAISTRTEATGIIRDGRFKPVESRSVHLFRGRENTVATSYDYERQRVELHAVTHTLLLGRRRQVDDALAIPPGRHIDDLVSAELNFAANTLDHDSEVGADRDRQVEERTSGRTHHLGVVQVDCAAGQDDGIRSGGVRRADDQRGLPVDQRVVDVAGLVVRGVVSWRERRQPVDVAVEHGEGRGNEHRVVDLDVGGAGAARALDVGRGDLFAAFLHLGGNRHEGFQLRGYRGGLKVTLDGIDDRVVAAEVMGGGGPMAGLTEMAVVAIRDERGDHLFRRGLACGTGDGDEREVVALADGAREHLQRERGVADEHDPFVRGDVLRRLRHHRAERRLQRLRHELMAVEPLALDGEEDGAGLRPLVLSAGDDGARLGKLESKQPALAVGAQRAADVAGQRHPGAGGTPRLAPRNVTWGEGSLDEM